MKHNSNIRLFKTALLIGVLGLIILLGIIVSGAADPEPLFCIGTPIGLLLCFVGAILMIITYTCEIFRGIREKKFIWVIVLLILGGLLFIRILLRP